MPGFFHFLPTTRDSIVDNRKLKHSALPPGLRSVLSDCITVPDECLVTEARSLPDGTAGSGVCIYPKGKAEDPLDWKMNLNHQTWIKTVDRWIGWETDRPPAPEDLQRKKIFSDYTVKDAEQRLWSIPCARSGNPAAGSLPAAYVFGDNNGSVTTEVLEDYQALWALSADVMDFFSDRTERDLVWQIASALECLRLNYRIDRAEINALHHLGLTLLTRETVPGILLCLIDHDLMQEAAEAESKKKASESKRLEVQSSQNVLHGQQADTVATDLPEVLSK